MMKLISIKSMKIEFNNLAWKWSISELNVFNLLLLVLFGCVFGSCEQVSLEHFFNGILSLLLIVFELNFNLIDDGFEWIWLIFGEIWKNFSVELDVRSVETANKMRVFHVEVSGGWVDCCYPLSSDCSSSEFSADIGFCETFFHSGNCYSKTVFRPSIKALCKFHIFLSRKPCHFLSRFN